MMGDSLQGRVGKAFIWKILERSSIAVMTFVIQIVLARLLTPSDFGTIAILLVFVQISNVFVQSGFNTALIQAKEIDDDDYSSVLWLNLLVATVLYALWFFLAPTVAAFYENPLLIGTLRVLALMIIPGAINSVQIAHLSRQLNFKAMFITNFIAVLLSGFIGIGLALLGCGVWALVFNSCQCGAGDLVMSFVVKWKPRPVMRNSACVLCFHSDPNCCFPVCWIPHTTIFIMSSSENSMIPKPWDTIPKPLGFRPWWSIR